MSLTPRRWRPSRAVSSCLLTLLTAGHAWAHAQAQTQAATPARAAAIRPDPLDPKAPVPLARYESAFAQSRRSGEDKPVPWREANETVARIGGWRVYAREAQQPDPAVTERSAVPSPAPQPQPVSAASAAKPVPAGHVGHKH